MCPLRRESRSAAYGGSNLTSGHRGNGKASLTAESWSSSVREAATPEHEHWSVVIRPAKPWGALDLRALWQYRELVYFLAWRDVKVRYKQTVLGLFWALLKPFLTMLIFSVVFGHFAHIPSEGVPYPIFSYCGLLPWLFFSQALTQSSLSLIANVQIVSKVYFPRVAIPLSAILSSFVDFAVGLILLVAMMAYYHIHPTAGLLAVPLLVVLATVAATGVGLWLSALSVRYRDVAHIIPFLVQLWMFATPVVYPAQIIGGKAQLLVALNPMAGVVEGFRWATLGVARPDPVLLFASGLISVALLVSGLLYFSHAEPSFADLA